jgi:hypothetical protein
MSTQTTPPKFSVHVIPDNRFEQTRNASVECLLALATDVPVTSTAFDTWRDNVSNLGVISNPIELCEEMCQCIKTLKLLTATLNETVPVIGSVTTNENLSGVETGLSDESTKIIAEMGFCSSPVKCIEIYKKYPKNHIAMLFCIEVL